MLLDISVHSPSDLDHLFKYLTFEPDDAFDTCCRNYLAERLLPVKTNNLHHGWIAGSPNSNPPDTAIDKLFEEIKGEGPFDTEEEEGRWWQQLPLVPAITGILLRRQTHRRWKPAALAHILLVCMDSRKSITSLGGNGLTFSRLGEMNVSAIALGNLSL